MWKAFGFDAIEPGFESQLYDYIKNVNKQTKCFALKGDASETMITLMT